MAPRYSRQSHPITYRSSPTLCVVDATETFEVTLQSENGLAWQIEATHPDEALREAVRLASNAPGIYSVWDPQDPMGMPLVECEVVGT